MCFPALDGQGSRCGSSWWPQRQGAGPVTVRVPPQGKHRGTSPSPAEATRTGTEITRFPYPFGETLEPAEMLGLKGRFRRGFSVPTPLAQPDGCPTVQGAYHRTTTQPAARPPEPNGRAALLAPPRSRPRVQGRPAPRMPRAAPQGGCRG